MGNVITASPSAKGGGSTSASVVDKTAPSSSKSSSDSCSLRADALKALEMFGLKDTPPQLPPAIDSLLRSPCAISTALTSSIDSKTTASGNVSTTTSNTSTSDTPFSWSTMSNPYQVLTESFGLQKSALTTAPGQTLMTSFSAYLSDFISQHFIAIALGATVGAAVATGIAVGLFASASLIHASTNYVVLPAISQWSALAARIRRRIRAKQPLLPLEPQPTNGSLPASSSSNHSALSVIPHSPPPPPQQEQTAGEIPQSISEGGASLDEVAAVHLSGSVDGIWIIKGTIRPIRSTTIPSSLEQCRECLQRIATSLKQQHMSLDHVRRWTVYLKTDRCSKNDFVRALQSDYPQLDLQHTMMSYLYVQRLEDENAVVQVEVMASSTSSPSNE